MSTFEGLPVSASMIPIEAKGLPPKGITTNKTTARLKEDGTISLIGIGHTTFYKSRSAKFVIVFSLLLIFTTMTLHTPSVLAQGEPAWWTKQKRDCGLSASLAYNTWVAQGSPCKTREVETPPPLPLDPRQIALQNALPRYNALVHSLSDKYKLLDEKSWLNFPLGTEAEFFDGANQMHKLLVNRADGIRFREGKVREELVYLNEVIETYPSLIANLRTNNERKQLESNRLTSALEHGKQQLELTQRAAKQLDTRAYRYEEDVKRDKETLLGWFTVLLPPGMVKTVSPKPYESITEPLVGGVSVRQPIREAVELSESDEPIRLRASKYGIRFEINPKPLTGTAEDAVAQLEADATAYGTAFSRTPMINEVFDVGNRKRPNAAQLEEERINVIAERERLDGEIKTFGGQLKVTAWALVLARDTLQSAQETFLYRAADAWIWKNAKSEAIDQLKNEVRRLVAAKSTDVLYRDMTDVEMREFFSAGRRNIFGLADTTLSSGNEFYQVLNRFQILRTHTLEHVQESVRVAALGSPREMLEFLGGMDEGIDEDCKQLVKAVFGALKIPEPWQSIAAKHFLTK
jgi:hypothetical protein